MGGCTDDWRRGTSVRREKGIQEIFVDFVRIEIKWRVAKEQQKGDDDDGGEVSVLMAG